MKWGYFSALSSHGKALCLFTEDIGIYAEEECGNSINESKLVLIAAAWVLDLLKQRQVIKGDSAMMIRASLWLQSFPHLKSFQASGSSCYDRQSGRLTCLHLTGRISPSSMFCVVWCFVFFFFDNACLPCSPLPLTFALKRGRCFPFAFFLKAAMYF